MALACSSVRPGSITRSLASSVPSPAFSTIDKRKFLIRGGTTSASLVSADARNKGPNFAFRLISNNTSSEPLGGRFSYSSETIARVLTVKSSTDWNVRTGGSVVNWRSRCSLLICLCSASVRSHDWRAPLTGNELYLNGLNSGRMLSQAAFAKAGNKAGSPANPANRANVVTPTIGEISIIRFARGRRGSSIESKAYLSASDPPFEKPTICSGAASGANRRASRTANLVAASHLSQATSANAAGVVPCAGMRIATTAKS